jgi:N6-L-threonylcarbamoyladenine synthase
MRDSYDFSFSGLKTAVLHQIQGRQERESKIATKNLPRNRPGTGKREQGRGNREEVAGTEEQRTTDQGPRTTDRFIAQLAHAFQESVVDVLVTKTINAAREFGATEILLAGGVAANMRLREEMARRAHVPVRYPPIALCTDNAAMVAAAAYFRFEAGVQSGWDLDVSPNLKLGVKG